MLTSSESDSLPVFSESASPLLVLKSMACSRPAKPRHVRKSSKTTLMDS